MFDKNISTSLLRFFLIIAGGDGQFLTMQKAGIKALRLQ